LIVDDERLLARAMCEVLSDHHDVEHAGSVAAARLRLGGAGRFDVVLCDVQLPDGDAGEVHAAYRQIAPGGRFVLVTGGDVDAARALGGGAPVLRKPFDLDDLPAILAALVA
jgi:DNA-binding response OmpR family regulator